MNATKGTGSGKRLNVKVQQQLLQYMVVAAVSNGRNEKQRYVSCSIGYLRGLNRVNYIWIDLLLYFSLPFMKLYYQKEIVID